MGLIDRIRTALRGMPPPTLRSRVGGYAWVKSYGHEFGADVLAGRAVKTVTLSWDGFWLIDPPQHYILKGVIPLRASDGGTVWPGERVHVIGLSDDVLEPWKEDGVDDAEVRDLYAPSPKIRILWGSNA